MYAAPLNASYSIKNVTQASIAMIISSLTKSPRIIPSLSYLIVLVPNENAPSSRGVQDLKKLKSIQVSKSRLAELC